MAILKGPVDRRLWLVTVVAIVAIVAVGIVVNRNSPGYVVSPIPARLAAAAIVTGFVVAAKVFIGPRAAALTGVVGVLIAIVVLNQMA